jgi:hypothetical protein
LLSRAVLQVKKKLKVLLILSYPNQSYQTMRGMWTTKGYSPHWMIGRMNPFGLVSIFTIIYVSIAMEIPIR